MKRQLLLACLFLAACSTPNASLDGNEITPDGRLFGDYLAGAYANNIEDADARANYYADAFSLADDNVSIGRRAVTFALLNGEFDAAADLAANVLAADATEPLARAVAGTQDFVRGRHPAAAEHYLSGDPDDLTLDIAMDLMRGWNAVARGDVKSAKSAFETLGGGGYFETYGELQIAQLEAMQPGADIDAILATLDVVAETGVSAVETALARARILSAAGRLEEAQEDIREFSESQGGYETGPVRRYQAELAAGRAPRALTPRQLAARAMTEPAFGFFARARAFDASEIYLRFALELDPDHDKAKLWLGSLLEQAERRDDAMELYQAIGMDSDYVVSAKLAEASLHFDRDDDAKGLQVLEAVNTRYPSKVTRDSLGRARLIRENYEDALPIYDALVKSLSDAELAADPNPIYFRGISYERTGDFDAAVADFKRVLELDPDNADALNYLGYSWVDRGENLTEAFDMIERAVELQPNSGAIIDSLGWAHYKLGNYGQARKYLEEAVVLSPSSATIVDHLGDVYWKLGRRREAGYQWQRALTFEPTDEERETIADKLRSGLSVTMPAP